MPMARKKPIDRKMKAALGAVAAILVIGFALSKAPREYLVPAEYTAIEDETKAVHESAENEPANSRGGILELPQPLKADPRATPEQHVREAGEAELRERFNQAVIMLHAGEYEYAIKALHRVLEMRPRMPEAHVNMGFALLGEEAYGAAADFFATAIELNTYQTNAYYGLAVAMDGTGNREAALGAMRSFIHLAGDAEEPYLATARAALWEWQAADNPTQPQGEDPAATGAEGS
jgi:tetratricopeptide (TPR) repeat protein